MTLREIIEQIEKNLNEINPPVGKSFPVPVAVGATIIMGRGKNRFVR